MTICTIPYSVPSQNDRDQMHPMARHKERRRLTTALRWLVLQNTALRHAGTPRVIHIHSIRRQRMHDEANLIGGCKGLIDAMKHAGILVDDSRQWMTATYSDAVLSTMTTEQVAAFGRVPITVITVTDKP